MTIALQYTNVTVADVDESIAFYRDALGLEVRNDVASEGFRWVTVGAPGQDVGIVLFQPHGGLSPAEADDLDATFETVRASGAEVLQEPIDMGWGQRDCAFRDPSGNMVRIAQAPAA
jgi:catechol 2,3-dioxygenase-like lactoylglutathione lyase family enzyme